MEIQVIFVFYCVFVGEIHSEGSGSPYTYWEHSKIEKEQERRYNVNKNSFSRRQSYYPDENYNAFDRYPEYTSDNRYSGYENYPIVQYPIQKVPTLSPFKIIRKYLARGLRRLGIYGLANRIDRQFGGGIFSAIFSNGAAVSSVFLPTAVAAFGVGEQTGINDAIVTLIADFIIPTTTTTTTTAEPGCTSTQFTCDNGKCIDEALQRCNVADDCGDNSDEQNCGAALLTQTLGALQNAASCNQLELDKIKIAYATALTAALAATTGQTVLPSDITITCNSLFRNTPFRKQITTLVIKLLAIGDPSRSLHAMQNLNPDQLNSILSGDSNDIAFVNVPTIDTKGQCTSGASCNVPGETCGQGICMCGTSISCNENAQAPICDAPNNQCVTKLPRR